LALKNQPTPISHYWERLRLKRIPYELLEEKKAVNQIQKKLKICIGDKRQVILLFLR
jgi:hypothetical protein